MALKIDQRAWEGGEPRQTWNYGINSIYTPLYVSVNEHIIISHMNLNTLAHIDLS